jgi:ATP-dependent DNA ligase
VRLIDHRDLMLATSAAKPFERAGWIFELKYDGFRVLAVRSGKEIRLLSRRGNDLAPCFPRTTPDANFPSEIANALWKSDQSDDLGQPRILPTTDC